MRNYEDDIRMTTYIVLEQHPDGPGRIDKIVGPFFSIYERAEDFVKDMKARHPDRIYSIEELEGVSE